jgi:hypothetical protein
MVSEPGSSSSFFGGKDLKVQTLVSSQSKSPKESPNQTSQREKGKRTHRVLSLELAGKERRRLRPRLFLSIPMRIQWRLGEEEPWAVEWLASPRPKGKNPSGGKGRTAIHCRGVRHRSPTGPRSMAVSSAKNRAAMGGSET